MDQMMELRLRKKHEYLEEESLMRQEKKSKLEMFKNQDTEKDEQKQRNKYGPGVWSYEPDYYPWGKTNPCYSISGKLGRGFLDEIAKKKNDNLLGFESNAKLIANSLTNGIIPLPNYDTLAYSPPKYSFGKDKNRFVLPNIKNSTNESAPSFYFKNEFVTVNNNKNKLL
jgi:hypothetical protein